MPKVKEAEQVVSMNQKSSKKQPSQKKKKPKKSPKVPKVQVLNLEAEPERNVEKFDRIFNVLTAEDRISEKHS